MIQAKQPARTVSQAQRRRRAVLQELFGQLALAVLGVAFLVPTVWMISTSLKQRGLEFTFPPQFIPEPVVWRNYIEAVTALPFHLYLRNTLIITVTTLVGTLLSASLVAYGFARIRFPGREPLFIVMLSEMMLPYVVTLIPTFILFRQLGWIDTFLPLTIPSFFGGGAYNIFLIRQFYLTIPTELDEAARIDGASHLWIWARVLLPLSRPVLITIAIFSFLFHWNDFMGPLIYLNSDETRTIALGLRMFQGAYTARWNLTMAVATLTTVPVLIIFFLAQRYFIKGIVMTGLTGR